MIDEKVNTVGGNMIRKSYLDHLVMQKAFVKDDENNIYQFTGKVRLFQNGRKEYQVIDKHKRTMFLCAETLFEDFETGV